MREIKFRAWHNDQMSKPFTLGEAVCWPDGKVSTANRVGIVMQFTGLLDCNGVEIYESDVLLLERGEGVHVYQMDDPNSEMRIVKFDENGSPNLFLMDGRKQGGGLTWCKSNAEKCFAVIGSVHQNPDLLEDA